MATLTLQTTSDTEDLYLPDGHNLVLLTGLPAVTQDVRSATKMRLTEDLYNANNGVDWLGTVLTAQPDFDMFRKSLSDNILNSPDVVDIQSLVIDNTQDVVNFTASIVTLYGVANI